MNQPNGPTNNPTGNPTPIVAPQPQRLASLPGWGLHAAVHQVAQNPNTQAPPPRPQNPGPDHPQQGYVQNPPPGQYPPPGQ